MNTNKNLLAIALLIAFVSSPILANEEQRGDEYSESANTEPDVSDVGSRPVRRKIGHEAPMNLDTPPHEKADHRKVYEVPDCENMSNMYHSRTDQFDPILQEMMKRCEDADAAKKVADEENTETGQ